MSIDKDLLDQLMEGRKPDDLFVKDGILQEWTKTLAERALSSERDAHLTEERADPPPEGANQPPNRRNGTSPKTVTTDSSKVALDIPRDRNGSFDPLLIAKYQRRFPEFDSKFINMYARGMTARESEPLRRLWFEPNGERGMLRQSIRRCSWTRSGSIEVVPPFRTGLQRF